MASGCHSYAVEGDPTSGLCAHYAGYQTAGDEVAEYCACHYGEPYDPAECAPKSYVLSPANGRVGKARQVPTIRIPAEPIDSGAEFLNAAIERAFFKYHKFDIYTTPVQRDDSGEFATAHLYCWRTDRQIATIHITKESTE